MNLSDGSDVGRIPFGLSLGGGPIGNLFDAVADETATATIEAAWNGGIRYFDTAPHYGLGLSERRFGAALAAKPREEFTISTKVGRRLVERDSTDGRDNEGFDVPRTHDRVMDFTESGLRQSLDGSLLRLGLDAVDVIYLHDPELAMADVIEHGGSALEAMRADGLCQMIGVGTNDPAAIVALVERFDLDIVMAAGSLTLLDQSGLGSVVPVCEANGVEIVAAGVFNSGVLAVDDPADGRFAYERPQHAVIERVNLLRETCAAYGTPLRSIAMAFPARYGSVSSVCIGAKTPSEVVSNIEAWAVDIPDELWQELESLDLIDVLPHESQRSQLTTNGSIQT